MGSSQSRLGSHLLAVALVAVLAAVCWGFVLELSWTGIDALPLIDASHVGGAGDLGRILTQESRASRATGGSFYRPVTALSYAAGYALWGLHPLGFHLVDLLLHGLNALLLRQLLLQGLGRRATKAALAGALLFLVHPAVIETLPAIARRSDVLATTFFLICLVAVGRSLESARPWPWRLAAWGAGLLALGSKELAFPLPLVVAALVAVRVGGRGPSPLRRALVEVLPFGALVFAVVALRVTILGGIGGYAAAALVGPRILARRAAVVGLHLAVDLFDRGRVLLAPLAAWRSAATVEEMTPWGVALVVVAVGGAALVVEGRRRAAERGAPEARRRALLECVLHGTWIAAVALLFAASKAYNSWYAYLPAAAASALLVAVARWAALERGSWRGVALRSAVPWSCAVALLVASPLLRDYPEWRASSRATDGVLSEVRRLEPEWRAAAGPLFLVGIPSHVERPEDEPFRVRSAAGLWDYSVAAWMRLQGLRDDDAPPLVGLAYLHPRPREEADDALRLRIEDRWRMSVRSEPPEILAPRQGRPAATAPDGSSVFVGDDFGATLRRAAEGPVLDVQIAPRRPGEDLPAVWAFSGAASRIFRPWDGEGHPGSGPG